MSSLTLSGFQILDTLRQTSKTITVKAVQTSLERTVALTFLRPELASNPAEVKRFLSVARVCSQLKADGLPQIYDIATQGDQPYMIMEHVEGLSLAEIVPRNGPMPIVLSVRVAQTIADALDHAWKQSRLVHRNLKPSEIRIDSRGMPKLTDFGRATVILPDGRAADEEEAGVIVGTPNFLSPEQVMGSKSIDCRADIYALGATLYYMITGRVPFPDSEPEVVLQKQLHEQIPHPRTFRPDIPTSVSGLLTRLMMKQPEDRYADWGEAMGDMQSALKNLPLRRREAPLKGISTISSVATTPDNAPAPELPQLRKLDARSGGDRAASAAAPAPAAAAPASRPMPPPPRRPSDSGLSAFVRIVLWLLLVIWLVLVGNDRIGNPLMLPLPSPLLPLDAWLGKAPTPVPTVAHPENPRTPPTPPVPAVTSTPVAPQTPVVTAAPPVRPSTPEKPLEPEKPKLPQNLPDDVKKRLADALVRGDLDGARALLAPSIPIDPARLAEFRAALAALHDPLKLAEETLLKSKGQEMPISYMGKERKIIPRNVANGEIEADYVAADGNRPVTFKLARFTPEDVLKLLPPQPETPAVHATVCLALLKANRKADIAAHVPYCGVLGPVFEAAAQP